VIEFAAILNDVLRTIIKFRFISVKLWRSLVSKLALTLPNLWYCNIRYTIPKLCMLLNAELCTSEQIQKKGGIILAAALNKTAGVRMFILD
jgi:hypothetical protein